MAKTTAVVIAEPDNKHKRDTAADVVVIAVVETEFTGSIL
jgi:hypothetical protein